MAILNDAVNLHFDIVLSEPFRQYFQYSSLQSFSSAAMPPASIGEKQPNSHWVSLIELGVSVQRSTSTENLGRNQLRQGQVRHKYSDRMGLRE